MQAERKVINMSYIDISVGDFTKALASKTATPGGGSAAALVGALAASLSAMVCALTLGKEKYAQYENEVSDILGRAQMLRAQLALMIDGDAQAFEPLSMTYVIPKENPKRAQLMENALRTAAAAPLETLRLTCAVVELHACALGKTSQLAISDIGTGAAFCKSAMQGSAMNVKVNTALMADRACAETIDAEVRALLEKYIPIADVVYARVWEML